MRLAEALDAVPAEVRQAFLLAHERLVELGIPHVLIGDLAACTHGYPHSITEIHFLVKYDAVFEGIDVVTFRDGVPIRVGRIPIRYSVLNGPEAVQRVLAASLERSAANLVEPVVAPPEVFVSPKAPWGRGTWRLS